MYPSRSRPSRTMPAPSERSFSDWYVPKFSKNTPMKLLKRIMNTGIEMGKKDVDLSDPWTRLNIGTNAMSWFDEACRIPKNSPKNAHKRALFIDKLEKQAIYHEKKKAEMEASAAAIWEASNDGLAAHHIKVFHQHRQKLKLQQQQQALKRVAEASPCEYERSVRARREAIDRKRADTVVAMPPRLSRNRLGQAIKIERDFS